MSEALPLHPMYKPATEDSFVYVRFLGNTARVGPANFHNVDPFQMHALAAWLVREANKMLDQAEARALAVGLRVTDKMPDRPPGDGRPAGA